MEQFAFQRKYPEVIAKHKDRINTFEVVQK